MWVYAMVYIICICVAVACIYVFLDYCCVWIQCTLSKYTLDSLSISLCTHVLSITLYAHCTHSLSRSLLSVALHAQMKSSRRIASVLFASLLTKLQHNAIKFPVQNFSAPSWVTHSKADLYHTLFVICIDLYLYSFWIKFMVCVCVCVCVCSQMLHHCYPC